MPEENIMAGTKAVVDTNVFTRALIGSKVNEELYDAFINGNFELVTSRQMLLELADVLSRPRLRIPSGIVKRFFHSVERRIKVVKPKRRIIACRDPKDNIVLETAITAKADFIVTNDIDLLILNPFHNISIVTPKEFLEKLKEG